MRNFKDVIIEKLKVSKDSVANIDYSVNDLQELAKLWNKWKRHQKSKFPELPLRAIYKKLHIELPSKEHPTSHIMYYLSSFMGYERMDGGCNVTLFYYPKDNKTLCIRRETYNYDQLIDFLGNGNVKDGEDVYNEIVNKLNN